MSNGPEFHFDVSTAEIEAAIGRGGWLCEHVFTTALAQFLEKKHTAALINNPRPRSRRAVTRRRTRRSPPFRP